MNKYRLFRVCGQRDENTNKDWLFTVHGQRGKSTNTYILFTVHRHRQGCKQVGCLECMDREVRVQVRTV